MARIAAVALVLLALALGCYAAPGDPAPTYECDAAACAEIDGCMCASLTNPGGFAVAKTPQFVLLTFDDSILPETMQLIEGVLAAGHKSANTCPLKLTFYTTAQHTHYNLAHSLWAQGHEIAGHTSHHSTTYYSTEEEIRAEVKAGRLALNKFAHIPEDQIRGFRAPMLEYSETMLRVLQEEGFKYDSSIKEYGNQGATWGSLLSNGAGNKIWPYSMHYGVGQHCDDQARNNTWCTDWRSAAGLWEIPVWSMDTVGAWPSALSVMDNLDLDTLKANFDAKYSGNRHPFGLYLHPARSSVSGIVNFLAYAASKPDVYFVTASQLLAWMEDPKDTDHMQELFPSTCDMAGAGPSFPTPVSTCSSATQCLIGGDTLYLCTSECPAVVPTPGNFQDILCPVGASEPGYNVCAGSCSGYEAGGCAPVDCVVSDWSDWECDAECGPGTATRTRTVLEAVANGGLECPDLTETQACEAGVCNRDCTVSDWTEWSTCSESCGPGTRTKTRTVIDEAHGTGLCDFDLTVSEACEIVQCDVDCGVSVWSDWSSCDATCGQIGNRGRSRTVVVEQVEGGAACPALTESELCSGPPCPVDCLVSQWSAWQPCTASCGGGERSRQRSVVTPANHGGDACPSSLLQTEVCGMAACGEVDPTTGAAMAAQLVLEGVVDTALAGDELAQLPLRQAVSDVTGATVLRVVIEGVSDATPTPSRRLRSAHHRSLVASQPPVAAVDLSIRVMTNGVGVSAGEALSLLSDSAADGSLLTALHTRGMNNVTAVSMGSGSLVVRSVADPVIVDDTPPPPSGQEATDMPGGNLKIGGTSLPLLGVIGVGVLLLLCAAVVFLAMRSKRRGSGRVVAIAPQTTVAAKRGSNASSATRTKSWMGPAASERSSMSHSGTSPRPVSGSDGDDDEAVLVDMSRPQGLAALNLSRNGDYQNVPAPNSPSTASQGGDSDAGSVGRNPLVEGESPRDREVGELPPTTPRDRRTPPGSFFERAGVSGDGSGASDLPRGASGVSLHMRPGQSFTMRRETSTTNLLAGHADGQPSMRLGGI